jgi:uncharacterized integral membrane protein
MCDRNPCRDGGIVVHFADRRIDVGALIFGAILLVVGAYYLLEKTFGIAMPEINWDQVWPILVIALGASVVLRAVVSRPGPDRP